ncbi:glycosyltransferase [Tautonia sociabilis]|nr:glycosyltransferase [Tautonia sociabilis]
MIPPPPPISCLPDPGPRPLWSVMIPCYDADPTFLEATLRSVLDQDPGPERMQIGVVEDASPGADRTEALVRKLAPDRVEFHRNEANLRLAGNWNRCIELARGRWIHLLHQDDLISEGFYRQLERAEHEAPSCGAAFTRFSLIDELGHWIAIEALERPSPGVIEGWLERLILRQRVQCPAIVVRRSTYEALGGFRTDLAFALDWEMWVRIAVHFPVWYEPAILAHFRLHGASESDRLQDAHRTGLDVLKAREIVQRYVPPELAPDVARILIAQHPHDPPSTTRTLRGRSRAIARGLTPPVLWELLRRLKRATTQCVA